MIQSLDGAYLTWLYTKVERLRDGEPPYFELLEQMFKTKFDWMIPNDDNRVEDGLALRRRFQFETGQDISSGDWMDLDCSFLEMLVALSQRLSFQIDEDVPNCFWHILRNIGIDENCQDGLIDHEYVDDALNRVIWRNYEADGSGGLFPLQNPDRDQRGVELIYQLYRYSMEYDI